MRKGRTLSQFLLHSGSMFSMWGHRSQAPPMPNLKFQKPPPQATGDEWEVEVLLSRSSWTESDEAVDIFLLDPDVVACFEKKILAPRITSSSPEGCVVSRLSIASTGEELADERSFLEPKARDHRSGFLRRGSLLGREKGLGSSWFSSFIQNFMLRRYLNRGKSSVACSCLKANDNIWGYLGLGTLLVQKRTVFNVSLSSYPGSASLCGKHRFGKPPSALVDSTILEDYNSDHSAAHEDLVKNPPYGMELPPAPVDVISAFVILDDIEDFCIVDEENSVISPRASIKVQDIEEGFLLKGKDKLAHSSLESKKRKVLPSMKLQVIGSPICVRRSPRFLVK